jgi:dihydrofolate reductase
MEIVAGLFMSLDGVVESPERWQMPYFNDEMGRVISAQMASSDALLLGRRTYQEFAAFWPNQPSDAPFADYMNPTPKLVVSTTLDSVEWDNSTLLTGDVAAQLATLKQQPGKNLNVSGSGTLVRWLLSEGLLDDFEAAYIESFRCRLRQGGRVIASQLPGQGKDDVSIGAVVVLF